MLIMPVLFIAPLPPRFDPLFDLAGSGENRHVSRPGSLLAIAGERAPEREERQSEVVTSQSFASSIGTLLIDRAVRTACPVTRRTYSRVLKKIAARKPIRVARPTTGPALR